MFCFHGVSAYLEAVVSQITTPRLEKLEIIFFEHPCFPSRISSVYERNRELQVPGCQVPLFDEEFNAELYPREDAETYALNLGVICRPFDRQVLSHLTLEQERDSESHEEQNAVDRNQWHNFLGSFNNVKILRVNEGLVREISRSLRLDDGGVPLGLFPKLRELAYSGSGNGGNANNPGPS
ncbi:hypothetical protein BGY98DRAFT_1029789 [Russula aff. rugulosa BPL654]|nr:hypothetical protein BGY98DRAFT_1029789 [Russula aff. rugulosa BPL654]